MWEFEGDIMVGLAYAVGGNHVHQPLIARNKHPEMGMYSDKYLI
jgi:hypothetical protein